MASISVSREINASPDRVFEVFADLHKAPERVKGIKSLEVLTDGPISNGTRFRETRVMFGKEATEEMEFTAFEPGRRYVVSADSHGSKYRTEYTFDSVEGGAGAQTRVTLHFEATPYSFLAKMMTPMAKMMTKSVAKLCLQDMDDLKAHIEGSGV